MRRYRRAQADRQALRPYAEPCTWCGESSRHRCQMCHGRGAVVWAGNAVRWLYGWRRRLMLV